MDFSAFSARIAQLSRSLAPLSAAAGRLGVAPLAGREWFELLRCKLLPQVEGPPLLIVAIVGGTNIGKSVVFNHLAGETASAATPLAAGTKHPVCLVPPGLRRPLAAGEAVRAGPASRVAIARRPAGRRGGGPHLLARRPQRAAAAGAAGRPRRPFRRRGQLAAGTVGAANRRCARSLLLTQQKYNDAACKGVFRAANQADKPIVVIFNFCDLEADREFWPQWLARFLRRDRGRARPGLRRAV